MMIMIVIMLVCAIIAVFVAYPILTLIAIIAVIIFIFYRIISNIGPDIQGTTNSTEKRKTIHETQFYKSLVNEMHSRIKKYVLSKIEADLKKYGWSYTYETNSRISRCLSNLGYFECYTSGVSFHGTECTSGFEISFKSLGYRDLTDSQLKELKSHFETRIYFDLKAYYPAPEMLFLNHSYWTSYLFDYVDPIIKQAEAEYKSKYKPIQ